MSSEDLYQVVTYMYCHKHLLEHMYILLNKKMDSVKYRLTGYAGDIHVIPVYIPQNCDRYNDFMLSIKKSEGRLLEATKEDHFQ